jgi:hypothetical protein
MHVLLMRHGEKRYGRLSDAGRLRALEMCNYFDHADVPKPTHIIAMKPKHVTSSTRCVDTAFPMSVRWGIPTTIRFTKNQVNELVSYIDDLPDSAVVLVIWEHRYLVKIATALGVPVRDWNETPLRNAKDTDRFDVLWSIEDKRFDSYVTFAISATKEIEYYLMPLKERYQYFTS